IVYTNAAFDRLFGYPRGELLGSNVAVLHAPGDLTPQKRAADVIAALEANGSWSGEIENIRGDGSHFWCEVDVSSFDDSEHGPVWVSVHRDTTARRAAEDALQMSELKLRAVFERSPLGLALIDHRLRITAANPSFCSLLGYSEEELVGKSLDLLTPPEDVKRDSALISDLLSRRSGEFSVEKRYMSSAGRPLWVEVSGAVVPGVPGVSGDQVLVMVEDIRERKAAEERLSFMGSHDGFTGALNRTTVSATIGQALARAQRTGDYLGIALVDLDNFEKVNREHGHRTGDELLLAVAHGLEASLRSGDSFARVGSDEFAACYERLGSSLQEAEAVARALASRLLEAVDRSATANGLEIGCSIGIVLTRSRDRGPAELLAATEVALDLVKGRGGGGVQISCDDAPSPLVET
ncbi:MAG: PAS domain S-box protein, partial [Acidimicrobiia bacterium]